MPEHISKEDIHILAMEPIPYTLYFGTFVHTPKLGSLEILFDTLIGVNQRGSIDFIKENARSHGSPLEVFKEESPSLDIDYAGHFKYVDFSSDGVKFMLPGFIDTHIHASQYPNIGIGVDVQLLDWLNTYTFPLENQFTDSNADYKMQFADNIYSKVIAKTLESGTTCGSYFTTTDLHTTNLFAELLLKFGQRGFVGKVCMDENDSFPEYRESLEECKISMELILSHLARINPDDEPLVKAIVTPRFALSCSREMLRYLGNLSDKHGLPIQTHISENRKEIDLVKESYPECDNYASVYDMHNLLNKSTILAHAIHLDKEERAIVKSKNCSISHCPTSNSFISSGEAPVRRFIYEDRINVSLGTDVSGGFESSILGIIKHTILVSHHLAIKSKKENDKLSIADCIYMATQAGAIAVGLSDRVGSFEVGKAFDAQLIDLESKESRIDVFDWQKVSKSDDSHLNRRKVEDLLGKWVFSGDDRNCSQVWCNGRLVVDKYHHVDDQWVIVEKHT